MSEYEHILAKSPKRGGQTLKGHLLSVAKIVVKAAQYTNLNIEIARIGALLHDIGKASPIFQRRLREHSSLIETTFRHEIASIFFLKVVDKQYWDQIIDMIIAHHKSIRKDITEKGIIDLYENYEEEIFTDHAQDFESWSETALGILEECGMQTRPITINDAYEAFQYALTYCKKRPIGWSVWKGLLIGADHFASALTEEYSDIEGLFRTADTTFYNRKSELYPLSLIQSEGDKKHTFVKAPTGAGKTDFLLKRCKGRIFYLLPFQASINAMFERICKDLNGVVDDIRILHSTSELLIDEENGEEERAMQDKFGASIKVLTPHQIATIVFGNKGYETILLDLKGCNIILDEIHTYSDLTQRVVLKMIEILETIGCSIHVGTATIPTVLENAIINLLSPDVTQYIVLPDEVLETFNRHKVYKGESFEDFLSMLDATIKDGLKALLVCNRVGRAQALFQQMKERYPLIKKMLIHSRFKRKDRNQLEKILKEEFNLSTEACIVVSTQVVEVSLDISFDIMITDTAPIDALIQRFGRINRVRNVNTIGKLKPVCVIAPPLNDKDCMPYSSEVLQHTFNVLPDNDVMDERSIQTLIDKVYPKIRDIDINLNTIYENKNWRIKELYHYWENTLAKLLQIESETCITQSDEEKYIGATQRERRMMEVPVNYNSVHWLNLRRIKYGANPYIVSDSSYNIETGLDLKTITQEKKKPNINDIFL
jgi:CRISPR-associated endonuclease/helicase Cas3